MTKTEALVLFAFSIIIMYGVFWMKTMYLDAPAVAQEDDN
jgi:hypothetical protein